MNKFIMLWLVCLSLVGATSDARAGECPAVDVDRLIAVAKEGQKIDSDSLKKLACPRFQSTTYWTMTPDHFKGDATVSGFRVYRSEKIKELAPQLLIGLDRYGPEEKCDAVRLLAFWGQKGIL